MPFSQKSRSRLSYIQESSYGVTPAGNFTQLPLVTSTLNLTKERLQSDTIYPDRMVRTDRHGNTSVGGDIAVELADGNFDDMLSAVMMSDWDATPVAAPDELKVGTTIKTFTFEDYAADIDQARLFTGCGISSATMTFAPNSMVNTTFTVLGSDSSISATERAVDALTVNNPFDAYQGALQIGDTGGSLSTINSITSIELSINNGFEPAFVVGSSASQQIIYDMARVEGTLSAYFEDETLYNRFVNETETALSIVASAPGGSSEYTFFIPRAKLNSAEVPIDSGNARMISVSFVGLYDETEGSPLVIYRPDSS